MENNLIVALSDGELTACRTTTLDFEVSIAELTQLLLGYQTASLGEKYAFFPQQYPYMGLMLE
jgi:hypothetical protein